MRVLFVPYPRSWTHQGGHRTQQGRMADALRSLGVHVDVGTVDDAHDTAYDVVHAFDDVRPLLARGRPRGRLVVSPVYWPDSVVLGAVHRRPLDRGRAVTRARHYASRALRRRSWAGRIADARARRAALEHADLLVTYSEAEAKLLRRDHPRPLPPSHVAYSAVDDAFFDGAADRGRLLVGIDEPFVLCVARPEPIKNQLVLAESMRSLPERLVLVGAVLPGNEAYLDACRRLLPSLVHISHFEHDDLRHVYAAAAATALPSWFEVSGLALLESLAAGTPIVAAQNACLTEYYAEVARFHRPGDVEGLTAALAAALAQAPSPDALRAHARRFSWDATARQLLAAYSS